MLATPQLCKWGSSRQLRGQQSNLNWPPTSLPKPELRAPRAPRRIAFPNALKTGPAGLLPVPSELRAPPSRLQPKRGGEGGGWWRERPGRERAALGNNTSLFRAWDPTHMTAPAAPCVAPGSGSSSCSPRGASWDPVRREAHRSLQTRTPPSFPGTRVPRFPTTDAQATQSAFEISSSSPPPTGRYSGILRGGVGIKGLRSPRRGESATGPEPKDKNFTTQVPHHPAFTLSLPLGSRTSTLLGSLARGRGARAPPPPQRKQLFPETSPPSTLPTSPHALWPAKQPGPVGWGPLAELEKERWNSWCRGRELLGFASELSGGGGVAPPRPRDARAHWPASSFARGARGHPRRLGGSSGAEATG